MNKALVEYGKVTDNLRKEVEKKLKKLLKGNSYITFKELVALHFISDNIYTDLKCIDRDMICHADVHIDSRGTADVFTYGLEEIDASGLYEILLALEEKRIEVKI